MQCPYCGGLMRPGHLYGEGGRGVYWLPEGRRPKDLGMILSQKKIQEASGIVLDELYPVGFLTKDRPDSYSCEACGVLMTKFKTEIKKSI